jgi:hypothetical protein
METMTAVLLTGFGLKIATALLGALALWALTRAFDALNGARFRDWLEAMDPHDFALYAGLRILALAIFMGLVFSG